MDVTAVCLGPQEIFSLESICSYVREINDLCSHHQESPDCFGPA